MTADLWALAGAGVLIGGAAAWLTRRRRPAAADAATPDSQTPIAELPTCEGIGPPREPQQD